MKKFIVFLLLLFPLLVKADVDYDITHYYIKANILTNGDVEVNEAIYLDGEFNGYEREILYKGYKNEALYDASNITNIEVSGVKNPQVSFDIFTENLKNFSLVNYANNGDKEKYLVKDVFNGKTIRMYEHALDEEVVFLIKYTLKDVVILHNDVAEVRWNFIGNEFTDDINDLQIKLYLPKTDDTDNFRVWANSTDLTGEVEKGTDYLYAHTSHLDAYNELTVRTTFNKDLVSNSVSKKTNQDGLESILAEEQINADKQNALRKEIRRKYYGSLFLVIFYTIALAIIWVYVYIKYDKERVPQFKLKYNRDFIDDYNVEIVDYLMHKQITSNALSASIMNLIYKKNIKFEEISDKKDYKFTLVSRDNLNETENKMVDFLFNKVGKDNSFTTKELKSYATGTKTCNTFLNTYTAWKNAVIEDGKKEGFFEEKKYFLGIIMMIIGLLLGFFIINIASSFIGFLPPVLGIAFLVYSCIYTKKTEKGIEHYAKWQAFKNFLDDFGTFELKELPEITLWDRYLVYATIFGLADKVEKAMNVKIKEIDINSYDYSPIFIYNHVNIGNTINSSVSSAINGATAAVTRANATSSMSSGSGFGGGFSSGGGFGGGGGGGHGF